MVDCSEEGADSSSKKAAARLAAEKILKTHPTAKLIQQRLMTAAQERMRTIAGAQDPLGTLQADANVGVMARKLSSLPM